jgi:hypothetical protein
VIPARAATEADKPKIEVSVQITQRSVFAPFRHGTFFTLADLNARRFASAWIPSTSGR